MALSRNAYNAEWMRTDRRRNPEKYRERERRSKQKARIKLGAEGLKTRTLGYNLWHQYRMTLNDYNALLSKQNGVCAICEIPPPDGKRLHVDHSHATEEVRALLCSICNQGMIAVDNRE